MVKSPRSYIYKKDSLEKKTVAELKDICKAKGERISGLKIDVINRILANQESQKKTLESLAAAEKVSEPTDYRNKDSRLHRPVGSRRLMSTSNRAASFYPSEEIIGRHVWGKKAWSNKRRQYEGTVYLKNAKTLCRKWRFKYTPHDPNTKSNKTGQTRKVPNRSPHGSYPPTHKSAPLPYTSESNLDYYFGDYHNEKFREQREEARKQRTREKEERAKEKQHRKMSR
jgi:hypothetical protein